mgnify:CR=1 FL=1
MNTLPALQRHETSSEKETVDLGLLALDLGAHLVHIFYQADIFLDEESFAFGVQLLEFRHDPFAIVLAPLSCIEYC